MKVNQLHSNVKSVQVLRTSDSMSWTNKFDV